MARPRFSEQLYRRRRELGISTAQASRVLRLKERVIIAFEEGTWDDMPKSGYAQGMLASYASYLGLDAQRITRQFVADLSDYQTGGDRQVRRRGLGDGARMPVETRSSRLEHAHSGARGLLPTSGGYAGDLADFSPVSLVQNAHPRDGRDLGDTRDVRDRLQGGEKRYTMLEPEIRDSRRRAYAQVQRARGRDQLRVDTYGSKVEATSLPQVRTQRQRSGYRPRVPVQTDRYSENSQRLRPEQDYVTRRRVQPSDYVDDLRYDDQAHPYQKASLGAGGTGTRGIVDPTRPKVRRQKRPSAQNSHRRGRHPQQPQGPFEQILSFFSHNSYVIVIILLVLAVTLFLLIISSVSSCAANFASNGREETVSVSPTETESPDKNETEDKSREETSGEPSDLEVPEVVKTPENETKVEVIVALADGGVSWVEVTVDGESKVAETLTGPWSASYNVTKSMQVEVSDPTVVTVTRNGKVQTFDQKASGVGSVTIDGPASRAKNKKDDSTSAKSGTSSTTDKQNAATDNQSVGTDNQSVASGDGQTTAENYDEFSDESDASWSESG